VEQYEGLIGLTFTHFHVCWTNTWAF